VPKDEEAFLKVEDERDRADCNFRKVDIYRHGFYLCCSPVSILKLDGAELK